MSPWSTLKAEAVVLMAFCCRPVPIAAGYSEEESSAFATGLIMTAGITLFGNGWRGFAAVEEGVHAAAKEAQGLYSWSAMMQPLALLPGVHTAFAGVVGLGILSLQTPAVNAFLHNAPKSPVRSAVVKTLNVLEELGISKR